MSLCILSSIDVLKNGKGATKKFHKEVQSTITTLMETVMARLFGQGVVGPSSQPAQAAALAPFTARVQTYIPY